MSPDFPDYNKLRSNEKRVKEVTELGLAYNLLTAYTSFIAVDTEVRTRAGSRQPLSNHSLFLRRCPIMPWEAPK